MQSVLQIYTMLSSITIQYLSIPLAMIQANSAQVTITNSAGTKSLKIWDFFKFGLKARGTFMIFGIKLPS